MTKEEIQQHWNSLSEDQKVAAAAMVCESIQITVLSKGSYRNFIYDHLGLSPQGYETCMLAGGMIIVDIMSGD